FDRSLIESYMLQKDRAVIDQNYEVTDAFVRSLPPPERPRGADYHWKRVPAGEVAGFLSRLKGHPSLPTTDPPRLAEYISKKAGRGELTEWTVVLIDVAANRNSKPSQIGG